MERPFHSSGGEMSTPCVSEYLQYTKQVPGYRGFTVLSVPTYIVGTFEYRGTTKSCPSSHGSKRNR